LLIGIALYPSIPLRRARPWHAAGREADAKLKSERREPSVTRIQVPHADILGIRADNPGILTLSGTNSWLVGRDPAWLVDPGPMLDAHVAALCGELDLRGGLAGIALTHDHADHSEALGALRAAFPKARVHACRGQVDVTLRDGERHGPLRAFATPGHAPDHFAFIVGDALMSGDAVLGEGSVFIAPDPGALAGYLRALERLRRLAPAIICPGHGPLVLDAVAKLTGYIEHRRDRERQLLAALRSGARTVEELLDLAWADVPPALRPAAAVTLAAHLDKLEEEGRLPAGVQRPQLSALLGSQMH
jgi:glyoxylase-like metal-dependent hydrolase (beta-lactamase superfamily II)